MHIPTPRIYIFLAYQPCPIWTVYWGLCSFIGCPFNFLTSNVFEGGSKVIGEINLRFPHELALSCCSKLLDLSFLVALSSRSFNRAVFLEISWYFSLLFPCVKGALKLLEVLLRACGRCPRKYYPSLLVSSLCYEEGINRISSLISDRIYFLAVFTHFMWGGEKLVEVIENMVSTVFWIFYYLLTFSHSELSKRCTC